MPLLSPPVESPPQKRACSTFMQRSTTTSKPAAVGERDRFVVDDAVLKPDRLRSGGNRVLDDARHFARPAEDVDDVGCAAFGRIRNERRIGFDAVDLGDRRVDRRHVVLGSGAASRRRPCSSGATDSPKHRRPQWFARGRAVAPLRRRRENHAAHRGAQRVIEIPGEILDVFETDREAHRLGLDARLAQLVVGELRVRRRSRMDDQALGVADVGEMTPQLQRVDETTPGFAAAAQTEREDRAHAAVREPTRPRRAFFKNATIAAALATWRSMRSGSVSSPSSSSQASIGDICAPTSRSTSARARIRNAYSPNVSVKTFCW